MEINKPCQSYYFGQVSVDWLLDQIDQLKQELEESFSEKDVESLIEDRDKTIKFLKKELAEKQNTIDKINKEFVQAVKDWKTLCAEKDKEIERLNTIKNNAIECADLFKVALSVRQKDLAIQELEKIINIFEPYENDNRDTILKLNNNVSFIDYIEQRIKELRGK